MTTVLIVDDHARFRALARLVLEEEGYDVVGEASDCASGLVAADELGPDVVLLDVHLPDRTGFELAAALRRDQPSAAILMTSTHDGSDFEAMARRSGARGFVPKDELSGASIARLLA